MGMGNEGREGMGEGEGNKGKEEERTGRGWFAMDQTKFRRQLTHMTL